MITWSIILFFSVLITDIVRDYKSWLRNEPVNHKAKRWLRPLFLAPAGLLLLLNLAWKWPIWLLGGVVVTAMMFSWYWFLFDGCFNIIRGFGWWFAGSDDPDDPSSDNFLQNLKLWQQIVIKVGLVLSTTLIYIICLGK